MKEYPETHQHGHISIENIPEEMYREYVRGNFNTPVYMTGEFGVQIAEDGRVWININGIAFLRFKPMVTAIEEKVYTCLEHCSFFHGEDGCGHNSVDETARYEMEGGYPLCPLYTEE